MVQNLIFS